MILDYHYALDASFNSFALWRHTQPSMWLQLGGFTKSTMCIWSTPTASPCMFNQPLDPAASSEARSPLMASTPLSWVSIHVRLAILLACINTTRSSCYWKVMIWFGLVHQWHCDLWPLYIAIFNNGRWNNNACQNFLLYNDCILFNENTTLMFSNV